MDPWAPLWPPTITLTYLLKIIAKIFNRFVNVKETIFFKGLSSTDLLGVLDTINFSVPSLQPSMQNVSLFRHLGLIKLLS